MVRYETYGPFEVPRSQAANRQRALDLQAPSVRRFWQGVDDGTLSLSEGRGCYIFAIKAGRGITPGYVGVSTTGFKRECFQPTKKVIYQDAYNEVRRGTPVLVLVVRMTAGGSLSMGRLSKSEADFVETTLMHRAWFRNPELRHPAATSTAGHGDGCPSVASAAILPTRPMAVALWQRRTRTTGGVLSDSAQPPFRTTEKSSVVASSCSWSRNVAQVETYVVGPRQQHAAHPSGSPSSSDASESPPQMASCAWVPMRINSRTSGPRLR